MAINSSQLPGPITGVNSLAYTGSVPNMILMNRRPTTEDLQLFVLGFWWIIPVNDDYPTGEVWVLTSKADGVATWKRLGGGAAAGVETLTGNTGGPVDPLDGNINVVGSGSVTVTGNPATNTLTITTSGGGGGVVGVNKIFFTTPGSGSYIKPSNLVQLYVECVGGGGGSSGIGANTLPTANTGATSGAGGGGYTAKLYTAAQLSASEPYTVGAGGEGGVGADPAPGSFGFFAGTNGGNTTFGSGATLITATGGAAATITGAPAGGTGAGGNINMTGGNGNVSGSSAASGPYSGSGGNAAGGYGLGGNAGEGGNLGGGLDGFSSSVPGVSYGGGAVSCGGTCNVSLYCNGTANGASGGGGIIILTEYLS